MPVPVEELAGSPRFGTTRGQVTGERRFKVGGADVVDFIGELWGSYKIIGNLYVHTLPAHFPGFPWCIVQSVEAEPFSENRSCTNGPLLDLTTASAFYDYWKVTARYSSVPGEEDNSNKPDVPDGTFLTFSSDLGAEYLTVPSRTWKWSVDGTLLKDDVNVGVLVPTEDIVLSWQRVPLPPVTAIKNCRGCVNNASFMGHDAETVLFLGAKRSRDFQVVDTGLWKLEYHFKVKEVESTATANQKYGWNRFYRETAATNEHWLAVVTNDAGAKPPFALKNFDALFEFEP